MQDFRNNTGPAGVFLWLATGNGLYKYDGYQYTAYLSQPLNPNSIESNYIECVTSVKDGSIWIGHYKYGKGEERFDPATGIFTHYTHSNNNPSSIASDNVSVIIQYLAVKRFYCCFSVGYHNLSKRYIWHQ